MPIRRLEDTFTGTSATIGADELTSTALASVEHVKPHIQPGILCPAVAGKLLDGTTSHSGAYGTAQSDGKSYYYTDIKGSKPIKDPRIGGHFGSQRHKFQSLQLLEQETATHGDKVYSIDGREWCRAVGGNWVTHNGPYGAGLEQSGSGGATDSQYIEIVGYFNDANVLHYLAWASSNDHHRVSVNGGTVQATDLDVIVTPLGGRYVQAHSLVNLTFNSAPTLGINTLKIANTTGHYLNLGGAELIAQDTTSTATKSQIQIPSQNVVSYGKKFTVSGTPHYNPFAFKTDGTTAWASGAHNGTSWPVGTGSSANIDTATSLGLENWKHGDNYYKPYNGGRVVVWVASDGTIKTSVTVMPPNARSIANSASLTNATAKANASIANNTSYPTMEAGTIDHSLSEVAKTFHFREFGNGNQNRGDSGSGLDFTMSNRAANKGYVMDDGLTSLGGGDPKVSTENPPNHDYVIGDDTGDTYAITFIGTGYSSYSLFSGCDNKWKTIAQNLPYGTHVLKVVRDGADPDIYIDGIAFADVDINTHGSFTDCSFHQPKKPPIPEDAVVLADYMLMADHVVTVDGTVNNHRPISKGCRRVYGSRDLLYQSGTWTVYYHIQHPAFGPYWYSSGSQHVKITAFATNAIQLAYAHVSRGRPYQIDGSTVTATNVGNGDHSLQYAATPATLETHTFGTNGSGTSTLDLNGWDIVTPIHTSSHYQSFESPYLDELVGGDRNMEQTNLVVTSDGKTWDEVTRDTSYIGDIVLQANSAENQDWPNIVTFTRWRGGDDGRTSQYLFNKKDFAIAMDRMICLKTGFYRFVVSSGAHGSGEHLAMLKNGVQTHHFYVIDSTSQGHLNVVLECKRGDYLQVKGTWQADMTYQSFHIERA